MIKRCAFMMWLCLAGNAQADFTGKVVKVIDGDTVDVLNGGRAHRVRLAGVDAPESGQPFGQRSKQNLLNLTAQKQTEVITDTTDRYGRWLGTVIVNGINVNAEQVKAGMAWAYRYHGKAVDSSALSLEQQAREMKLGLWSDPRAIEPWKWRQHHKH